MLLINTIQGNTTNKENWTKEKCFCQRGKKRYGNFYLKRHPWSESQVVVIYESKSFHCKFKVPSIFAFAYVLAATNSLTNAAYLPSLAEIQHQLFLNFRSPRVIHDIRTDKYIIYSNLCGRVRGCCKVWHEIQFFHYLSFGNAIWYPRGWLNMSYLFCLEGALQYSWEKLCCASGDGDANHAAPAAASMSGQINRRTFSVIWAKIVQSSRECILQYVNSCCIWPRAHIHSFSRAYAMHSMCLHCQWDCFSREAKYMSCIWRTSACAFQLKTGWKQTNLLILMMNIVVLFGACVEEMHFVFVHFAYENRFTNNALVSISLFVHVHSKNAHSDTYIHTH